LQGWLPEWYVYRTKDIDIYISDVGIFVETTPSGQVYDLLVKAEFNNVYSEAGIAIVHPELDKPVEIIFPVGDIYVPDTLLTEIVEVEGLRVLEGHAVIVAKALGD